MINGLAEGYVKVESTNTIKLDFSGIVKGGLDSHLPLCCNNDKRLSDKELTTYTISLMKEVDTALYQGYRYGYEQYISRSDSNKIEKGVWNIIVQDIGE